METKERIDPFSGEKFIPKRANQFFATRQNQTKFNNQKAAAKRKAKSKTDQVLNKNREILEGLLESKNQITVDIKELTKRGFDFDYSTHKDSYPDNIGVLECNCIYEFGISEIDNHTFVLIRFDGKKVEKVETANVPKEEMTIAEVYANIYNCFDFFLAKGLMDRPEIAEIEKKVKQQVRQFADQEVQKENKRIGKLEEHAQLNRRLIAPPIIGNESQVAQLEKDLKEKKDEIVSITKKYNTQLLTNSRLVTKYQGKITKLESKIGNIEMLESNLKDKEKKIQSASQTIIDLITDECKILKVELAK